MDHFNRMTGIQIKEVVERNTEMARYILNRDSLPLEIRVLFEQMKNPENYIRQVVIQDTVDYKSEWCGKILSNQNRRDMLSILMAEETGKKHSSPFNSAMTLDIEITRLLVEKRALL